MSEPLTGRPGTLPRPHRLHDDAEKHPLAIGCHVCPDLKACGGLRIEAGSFSCQDRCCGGREDCDRVCLRRPDTFVTRLREVDGLELDNVPRTTTRCLPPLPPVVPVLYGGPSRTCYEGEVVALPLARLMRRTFRSVDEIADEFRFSPRAAVLVTGTDEDRPLERWWGLGSTERRRIARTLAAIGVCSATSPNFSMFTDRPRHDDLHSAKRIALAWQEMADEGLPTALHVNARTDADWLRWTSFVAQREEVDAIAYEFATPHRPEWHAARLVRLAQGVGRPLRLLVRGGRAFLPLFVRAFDAVTVVDTTAYMKTVQRQRAEVRPSGDIGWFSVRTGPFQPLDELLEHNVRHVTADVLTAMAGTCTVRTS